MSLLLDALKKAAEKKARKAAQDAASSQDTQVMEATEIDTTEIDTTEMEATEMEATQMDATEMDVTQMDATVHEQAEMQTQFDATEVDTTPHTLSDEDRTLLINDEDDDAAELAADKYFDDATQTELTDTHIIQDVGAEDEDLTEDDVTEFMGDGLRDETQETSTTQSAYKQSDDTTITNPDSLSLTNIEHDDLTLEQMEEKGYPMAQDATSEDTASLHSYDGRTPRDQTSTESLQQEDITGDVPATEVSEDSTSSTVDIDQLTSDETVTIKSTTATRTFAPDNYDRTLMKLADTDVSKIFPGMKSETDSVMTPDYAKKVFLTKSQGARTYYVKIYAGIAISILLVVIMWGMFQLQNESAFIDNSLVRLKRDPMPGLIKPKSVDKDQSLFANGMAGFDNKVIGILSAADEPDQPVFTEAMNQEQPEEIAATADEVRGGGVQLPADGVDSAAVSVAGLDKQAQSMPGEKLVISGADQQASKPAAKDSVGSSTTTSAVKIISRSRISEKDQLLTAAYESYETGDKSSARRLYNQVLSIDPENRDAMLGRAAIHVQDSEFDNAIRFYQQLLLANPKDSVAITSFISVANIDPQAGESRIKILLRDQPESPYLHFALGNMYGNQKRWTEAQSSYFTALQHKPGDPNYAYNLAVSLEHMDKPESAITFYQRALENHSQGLATFDSQLVGQRIEVLSR